VRIERLGSCRRLVFVVSEPHALGGPARAIVAKLIVPAEIMAELAQMIAADRPETVSAFARLPVDAVAH
jgi:histidinol-phosphate/aromatic aminotransferase/cobyric acid decarboxylase-like protein